MSPSLFRKRLRVLAGLPAAGGHPSGVVWERPYLCLIYLLDVGLLSFFFFFFNEGAVQLVFCSVFEEIAPCAAVDLLFLREQVNSD